MDQQWWVYIVQTYSGKLYTGVSTDVDRRLEEHKAVSQPQHAVSLAGVNRRKVSYKGAKFFRSDPAVAIVYRETSLNRSEACKREAQIKQMSRKEKLLLAGLPIH